MPFPMERRSQHDGQAQASEAGLRHNRVPANLDNPPRRVGDRRSNPKANVGNCPGRAGQEREHLRQSNHHLCAGSLAVGVAEAWCVVAS
jgi:hypothetical protein